MNIKKVAGLVTSALALSLSMLADVSAATIDTKCEVRSGRSKISVNGRGFAPGFYRATVRSGVMGVISKAFQRPVASELEFDFDSNLADVRAGATQITPTFIKNRSVRGNIFSYNTATRAYTLRASIVSTCKAK